MKAFLIIWFAAAGMAPTPKPATYEFASPEDCYFALSSLRIAEGAGGATVMATCVPEPGYLVYEDGRLVRVDPEE